ncbi:MAG: NAD(P)/FAD-dependent oxidoreductase [Acidobacteria bacterium]|nr:NAD(P)/FAD-dependent oxidoreductase [Acidobacteriota bacterium]
MRSQIDNRKSQIAIVGGGPAGSSAAIRLADRGFEVTLIEREKFPRHKLCGEFISPECLTHFAELGVLDEMLAAGGERIHETRFFDRKGRSFAIPSGLLDHKRAALGLSRSAMDAILLDHARRSGVKVFDGTRLSEAFIEDEVLKAISVVDENACTEIVSANLFIDASGRNNALCRLVQRSQDDSSKPAAKASVAVGFKNHFRDVKIEPGVCEIFSFPRGYGGLSSVENGAANLCFLMDPKIVRKIGSDPAKLVERAVCSNVRAAKALENASAAADWLAVSISSFGRTPASPIKNLFAVGDSAAFIDPFTGSGMLMAFESSALLSMAIAEHAPITERIVAEYSLLREQAFSRRLRVCSLLRKAAFAPFIPTATIRFLAFSKRSRNYIASMTRSYEKHSLNTRNAPS